MSEIRKPIVLATDPRIMPIVESLTTDIRFIFLNTAEFDTLKGKVSGILCIGKDDISRRLMESLPALRLIVTPAAGIEGIDLAAAAERKVVVTSGAGVHARDVAHHAIALTMASRHRIVEFHGCVMQGLWGTDLPSARRSITSDKIGIVGMGAIGQAVAAGVEPLCKDVGWYGPRAKDLRWQRHPTLPDLADWSDILILCARGDASTRGLITGSILNRLGPNGLFVNVARGFMADEDEIISALRAGRLGAAALDVFTQEPLDPDKWRDVPNLLFTPHTAGLTQEAYAALGELVVFNLRTLLSGGTPRNPVGT